MRVIHGAALAAWLLTGTGLAFGQTAPPPEKTAPAVWRTYLQPSAGFAVSSPMSFGKSVATKGNAEFLGKQVALNGTIFAGHPEMNTPGPLTFYLVTIWDVSADYHPSHLTPKQKADFLKSVIRSERLRLVGTDGQIIEDRPFFFESNPGRELKIKNASPNTKPTVITVRVFLFGDRICRLQVSRVDSAVNPVEVSRFLDSFRLMTDAEKEKFGTTRTDSMIDAEIPVEKSVPVSGHPLPPQDEAPKSGSTFQGNRKNTCE